LPNGSKPRLCLQVNTQLAIAEMCKGRPVEELPRILTILSPAHHLASAVALDRLFCVEPPPAAINMREALLKTFFIQNHLRKIYFLLSFRSSPLLPQSIVEGFSQGMSHWQDMVGEIVNHISLIQEAVSILGGRPDHPVCAVPGGMGRLLKKEQCERLSQIARASFDFSLTLAAFLNKVIPDAEGVLGHLAEISAEPLSSACFIPADGAVVIHDEFGKESDRFLPDLLFSKIGFHDEPWSYESFAFLRNRSSTPDLEEIVGVRDISHSQSFFVGPLARIDRGEPAMGRAGEEMERLRASCGPLPQFSVTAGFRALLVELIQSAESLLDLCSEDNLGGTDIRNLPSSAMLTESESAVESPQGLLYHHYKVDKKGLVEDVEILDATRLNNLFRCLIAQKAAENAVARDETPPGIKEAIELALLPF
jgi:F420-non-reducing hydrogenase large subunit